MKFKRTIFSLGGLVIMSAPIIGVLSCGSKSNQDQEYIDLSQVNSYKELIMQINKKIHILMPESGTVLGRPNVDPNYDPDSHPTSTIKILSDDQVSKIKSYMEGIHDAKINISYEGKTTTLDFQLTQYIKIVVNSLSHMQDATTQQKNCHNRVLDQLSKGEQSPNADAYIGKSAPLIGVSLAGFMALDDLGWNAYMKELEAFSPIFFSLSTSDLYKAWAANKQYTLLSIDSQISGGADSTGLDSNGQVLPTDETSTPPHQNIVNYASGQIGTYDDHNKETRPSLDLPKSIDPERTSNIEAEFILRLLDLLPSKY